MTSSEEEVKTVEIIINLSLDDQAGRESKPVWAQGYKTMIGKRSIYIGA